MMIDCPRKKHVLKKFYVIILVKTRYVSSTAINHNVGVSIIGVE